MPSAFCRIVALLFSATVVADTAFAQSAVQGDRSPRLIQEGIVPEFPDVLRALGAGRKVAVQYTVDSTGRADTTSLVTDGQAHPAFLAAIRNAIARMHFEPAIQGGHAVAADVIQEFDFQAAPAPAPEPTPAQADSALLAYVAHNKLHPAKYAPGISGPQYPPALVRAGIEGQVVARFVIDSLGSPDLKTFRVVRVTATPSNRSPGSRAIDATQSGAVVRDVVFAEDALVRAVRQWLPHMRFVPATVDGRAVAQEVEQPFSFGIEP